MSRKLFLAAGAALVTLLITGSVSIEAQPQPPAPPKKRALLVGVNKYLAGLSVPALLYAEADVIGLRNALKAQGYDVTELVGNLANRDYVISSLEEAARTLKAQDSFVLYLAGHGVMSNDHVYWLAHNTTLDFLGSSAIRLTHLMDYVKDIKAGQKIVLLDHCYSGELLDDLNPIAPTDPPLAGPIAPTPVPTTNIPRTGPTGVRLSGTRNVIPTVALSELTGTSPGAVVLAASRGAAYEVADFEHGVFTKVLLDALTSRKADTTPDGKLSVDELRSYVRTEVERISGTLNLPQIPLEHVQGSLQGWYVATGLPATVSEQVTGEFERIERVLRTWQQQGLLGTLERLKCMEVLEKWKDAVERKIDERTLPDYALLQIIREAVNNETIDLAVRLRALKGDLKSREGGL